MLSPERLALPDYEYLAQRHVLTYVEDAVCQLLENKEDISQYGIARFFTEYFNSVCQGTHILFREFSFIQATPHNRASFLRAFWRCFRTVGKNGDLLTMREYHCLLQLLCPDFPLELTQKAARIVLMDDAMDCLMSFSDFLFAFQIQFYYSEFLESVAAIYQDLLSGKNPNTVIVPTSSSGQHRQRPSTGEAGTPEGVEASLFYQCLENLCDRHKYRSLTRQRGPDARPSHGRGTGAAAGTDPRPGHLGHCRSRGQLPASPDPSPGWLPLETPPSSPQSGCRARRLH
ncbi:centriolar satellite-associated tubulin polyglutamylase complex regulator 1 isoform X3 [Bubalus kerabau]|uniref:centriolar satellite-associated tubulin polyglutamylase complex regulator 1 isoform X3 n=1 Tax=Bubalus carabanensis TaxID=3119969 RepID=UPI00244ED4EC|nr:centriolar satellite-associated tubulin polyglutamylase complex regulator 1 isoform X3 [Bubalus carabanensis]